MKMLPEKKKTGGVALLALLALVGLAPIAQAQVTFSYEDTVSGHAIGSSFNGPFRINLQLFDMGTLYPSLGSVGSAAGYGAGGTGTQTVAGGISTLNSLQTAGASGAVGNEDTWGIGRVLTITDLAGSVVWSESVKNAEMTLMFYGEQDYYINQLANGFQSINGVDLKVDWYIQNKSDPMFTQYNPLLGGAGRIDADSFTSVTDGNMFLSTQSVPGFIHADGTLGGSSAEFLSVFNATSGGTGQTYLEVTGGSMADDFDQNFFSAPYRDGQTADLFAQFTTVVNDPMVADWLVRGNDPVTGNFAPIPEPSTYGLIAAGALLGLAFWRKRAQKRV